MAGKKFEFLICPLEGCADIRAVFVWWAHGHVPTQYFEIYVAVHPISDVPVNCVPTQYLAPRYGTVLNEYAIEATDAQKGILEQIPKEKANYYSIR